MGELKSIKCHELAVGFIIQLLKEFSPWVDNNMVSDHESFGNGTPYVSNQISDKPEYSGIWNLIYEACLSLAFNGWYEIEYF